MKLHIHRYGPWGEPFAFAFKAFQRKTCKVCGKTKARGVGWAKSQEERREERRR